MPPLEAMACGTPVLVSDIPALRETAADAAVTANAFEPEEIADRLQKLLTDSALRETLRQRGFFRSQELTWDAAADRLLAVYAREQEGETDGAVRQAAQPADRGQGIRAAYRRN